MTTHLADIKTFLNKLDAAMISNDLGSVPNPDKKGGDKWAFIEDVEIFSWNAMAKRITYLYTIELRSSTEAIMEALLEKYIENIYKITNGTAITEYTPPTDMMSIEPYIGTEGYKIKYKSTTQKFSCKIRLKVEWK